MSSVSGAQPYQLIVADDDAQLAARVAERFVAAASAAIGSRGAFAVALAGGSTPKAAYALLASTPMRDQLDWSRVQIFFGDERCVPPTSDESNAKMAHDALLDHVPIPPANVFRMAGERDPQRAAADYERILVRELGERPVFDLVLLGMGPDGHTASLFPGTAAVAENRRLAVENFVPKLNAYRLTLTPPVLCAAREIVIAAGGAAKADALAAAINGPYQPNTYPVQVVRPTDGVLVWIVDRAAASKLIGNGNGGQSNVADGSPQGAASKIHRDQP